jgi:dTMP kinase
MYISFEGIDGAGKSTIMERVAARLRTDTRLKEYGYDEIVTSSEPKGIFRDIILDADNKYGVTELARFFLYQADRNVHTETVIKPNRDKVLLVDRGPISTMVYQEISTSLKPNMMKHIIDVANRGIWPECYIFFEIDYETSLERLSGEKDHFEKKGKDFFEKLINGYTNRLDEQECYNGAKVIRIDAKRSQDEVFEEVYHEVFRYIIAYDLIKPSGREFY